MLPPETSTTNKDFMQSSIRLHLHSELCSYAVFG